MSNNTDLKLQRIWNSTDSKIHIGCSTNTSTLRPTYRQLSFKKKNNKTNWRQDELMRNSCWNWDIEAPRPVVSMATGSLTRKIGNELIHR